jgi:hypothetical protein
VPSLSPSVSQDSRGKTSQDWGIVCDRSLSSNTSRPMGALRTATMWRSRMWPARRRHVIPLIPSQEVLFGNMGGAGQFVYAGMST